MDRDLPEDNSSSVGASQSSEIMGSFPLLWTIGCSARSLSRTSFPSSRLIYFHCFWFLNEQKNYILKTNLFNFSFLFVSVEPTLLFVTIFLVLFEFHFFLFLFLLVYVRY